MNEASRSEARGSGCCHSGSNASGSAMISGLSCSFSQRIPSSSMAGRAMAPSISRRIKRFLQARVVHRRKGEFNVGMSRAECLDKRWQKAVGRRPNKTDPQYAALT